MMRIDDIEIDESELEVSFVRSSGPGGQNVNKVATAVQLRFNVWACTALSAAQRERLGKLAGQRMTKEGILIIVAREHASQEQNRRAARDRLAELIRRARIRPKPRRATKPSRAAKKRRLEAKRRRSIVKRSRGSVQDE